MNKRLIMVFVVVALLGLTKEGQCNQKPKMNMDADNIAKAMKVMRSNQAIFQDPEKLAQFVRISKSLNKKK